MVVAVDPSSTIDYVLQADESLPAEQRTTWKLKVLTGREKARVADRCSSERPMEGLYEALSQGIVGWENLRDRSGTHVQPQTNGKGLLVEESLARIPMECWDELFRAIFGAASLSGDDRKN